MMRLFMFKSEKNQHLGAFSANPSRHDLPAKLGPWISVGVVRPEMRPPYNLDRQTIEDAIGTQGFQLYRLTGKKASAA